MSAAVPVSIAVDLLVALLQNAQQISQLIQSAQASGSQTLPADAWSAIIGADDAAETSLATAIAKAKSS